MELGRQLVRPFKMFTEDLAKESILTEAKFGSVDRVFVVCEGDEVMDQKKVQRLMIEEFPPKAVKCINGGGHMVMLSKPKQLFQHLIEIAEQTTKSISGN